eukprot:COSAG01_NODE_64495_length_276_cov_0.813559_1_plen_32_part_10
MSPPLSPAPGGSGDDGEEEPAAAAGRAAIAMP